MQDEIDAQKELSCLLIGEIQNYKNKQAVTEELFNNSHTMKKMREEAQALIKIIEEQSHEISQLVYFRDTYEKSKRTTQENDKKRDELVKIYQTELKSLKDNTTQQISNVEKMEV
jgi:hypothetical protein